MDCDADGSLLGDRAVSCWSAARLRVLDGWAVPRRVSTMAREFVASVSKIISERPLCRPSQTSALTTGSSRKACRDWLMTEPHSCAACGRIIVVLPGRHERNPGGAVREGEQGGSRRDRC
jgi:hypothetical protein